MISVILPAYNEEENIEPAVKEISAVLEGCGEDFELLFISDGSTDSTYDKIRTLSESDGHVKGVEFSRNFGKEAAIFAGLSIARKSQHDHRTSSRFADCRRCQRFAARPLRSQTSLRG